MTAPALKRSPGFDAARALGAFLVVSNHTISALLKAYAPGEAQWWPALLIYYAAKLAVPLYVLVSGALLLRRVDDPRKALWRVGRMALSLLAASYVYFLFDAWARWGLWPRMARLDVFVELVWTQGFADSFWYLYFYIGLMLMLPFLQRLAQRLSRRGLGCLTLACLVVDGLWPMLAHYWPGLALPDAFRTPLFTGYLGLFFAGRYLTTGHGPTRARRAGAAAVLAATLALNVALTWLEAGRVAPGERYLFMDDRYAPSLTIMLGAMALFSLLSPLRPGRVASRILGELGACSFGVYLLQELFILQTRERLFAPLRASLPDLAAWLVWAAAVYALAVAIVFVTRRLPVARRLL